MKKEIHRKVTLEEIEELKEQKLKEMQQHKEAMTERFRHLFIPPPATTKTESFIRAFDIGMAIFDGAALGLKTIGHLKRIIKRR